MKPNILMLGWEFPPHTSGGLGVATQALFEALKDRVPLQLLIPQSPLEDAPGHELIYDLGLVASQLPPLFPMQVTTAAVVPVAMQQRVSPYPPYSTQELDFASPVESQAVNLYGPGFFKHLDDYTQKATAMALGLDFDLIHAHDWMTFQAGLKIKELTQKPLILHVHSLEYDRSGPGARGPIYELEKTALQQADLIIAVSEYTKRIIHQEHGVAPHKIRVVHNGIKRVDTFRSDKPFPEKLILFLGRVTGQKGPFQFLSIARRVLDEMPNLRFVMAGKGELLPSVIEKAAAWGLGDRVHFTGFIDQSQVFELFSMADIFVMPSVSEPFGLVALEAAQFGIPCVLGMPSGASEVLNHALKAPHEDVEILASRILDLLRHPEIAEMIVRRTYEDLDKLDWNVSADKILDVYQEVL